MNLKKGLLLSALLISSSAFAALPKTGNISLGGGTIGPRESFSLPLTKLVPESAYRVQCKINDQNNGKNQAVISIQTMTYGGIYLNGEGVGYGFTQLKLPQVNNSIEVEDTFSFSELKFTNLDQDDTLVISECVAIPETANATKK